MEMDLPWFSLHVIITYYNGKNEPHILSFHQRRQTRCYYLVEIGEDESIVFLIPSIKWVADLVSKEGSRTRLMILLMEHGPFMQVGILFEQ